MSDVKQQSNFRAGYSRDRKVEDLIGKIVDGTISDTERSAYDTMVANKSRVMRPSFSGLYNRKKA
ncbi:hypothetical protein [Sphingomonas sp. SRS2]|uniref:hypothetical protein n=1 Tax=Sphingomonas sp. SRS2 TaxID=133190 RepID=UPI000618475F|nr:hypothetical protein [Sphingomonas sp. SRS2]KKC24454.1 hypothetical protein WP12_19385 [Sphingomonas sp. SRS2]